MMITPVHATTNYIQAFIEYENCRTGFMKSMSREIGSLSQRVTSLYEEKSEAVLQAKRADDAYCLAAAATSLVAGFSSALATAVDWWSGAPVSSLPIILSGMAVAGSTGFGNFYGSEDGGKGFVFWGVVASSAVAISLLSGVTSTPLTAVGIAVNAAGKAATVYLSYRGHEADLKQIITEKEFLVHKGQLDATSRSIAASMETGRMLKSRVQRTVNKTVAAATME